MDWEKSRIKSLQSNILITFGTTLFRSIKKFNYAFLTHYGYLANVPLYQNDCNSLSDLKRFRFKVKKLIWHICVKPKAIYLCLTLSSGRHSCDVTAGVLNDS